MNEREEQVVERRFDWALREVAGAESPPDVVAAVMARRAGREPSAPMKVRPMRSWLVAALVLLGLGVVALLTWEVAREGAGDKHEAQDRPYHVVTSLAQIEDLPQETTRVELRGLGASALKPLAERLPNLEALRFTRYTKRFVADLLPGLLGERIRARFPRLRELDLTGCTFANDDTVRELIGVPLLHTLRLGGTSVTEACVMEILGGGQLRRVDFGDAPWLTLAHCEQMFQFGKLPLADRPDDPLWQREWNALRERFAEQVAAPFYYRVGMLSELDALLPEMTHVELRNLGDEATRRLAEHGDLRGVKFVRDDDDAFTVASVRLLADMQQLEELHIVGVNGWRGEGFELLAKLPALRTLEVSGASLRDEHLARLPDFPALRELALVGERSFGAAGMASIAACEELTSLDLAGCDQLEDGDLASIGGLTSLRALDLAGVDGVGDRAVQRIAELRHLRRLDLRECRFSAEAARSLGALRELTVLLVSKNEAFDTLALNALPVALVELGLASCSGLDGAAGTILRDRFPHLQALDVSGSTWMSDAAMIAILQRPTLQHLDVGGCSQLTPACFEAIRDAKSLSRLRVQGVSNFDDEMIRRLHEARPDLSIATKIW